MDYFPLVGLPPILLEKIITKLGPKAYFRLQQTCHGMEEFVGHKQNIKVHVGYEYYLGCKKSREDGSIQLRFEYTNPSLKKRIPPVESLYGLRLKALTPKAEIYGEFDLASEALRKYRITSIKLHLSNFIKLTKEQCMVLFDILKPIDLFLESNGSNRYEALFQLEELKNLYLLMDQDPDYVIAAVTSLPPTLQKVTMTVDTKKLSSNEIFYLLRHVLLFLRSESLPNLREFRFAGAWQRDMPSKGHVIDNLFDYNPTVVESQPDEFILKCACQKGFSCKVSINRCRVIIHFLNKQYLLTHEEEP